MGFIFWISSKLTGFFWHRRVYKEIWKIETSSLDKGEKTFLDQSISDPLYSSSSKNINLTSVLFFKDKSVSPARITSKYELN